MFVCPPPQPGISIMPSRNWSHFYFGIVIPMVMNDSVETIKHPAEIRNALPGDAADIATLYKQTWLSTYPNEEYGISHADIEEKVRDWDSVENIEKWRSRLSIVDQSTCNLVAEVGGKVVGHSRLHKHEAGPNKLQTIYVLPEYHGTGIARSLVEFGLEWLDSERDIVLEVAKYNQRAISFYQKIGFEITGDAQNPISELPSGKTIPEYQMVRKAL